MGSVRTGEDQNQEDLFKLVLNFVQPWNQHAEFKLPHPGQETLLEVLLHGVEQFEDVQFHHQHAEASFKGDHKEWILHDQEIHHQDVAFSIEEDQQEFQL